MSMNYYYNLNICPCCGRCEERIHLGKNSYGRKFLLQANPSHYKPSWYVMKNWLLSTNGYIEDEYGRIISKNDFIKIVEGNQKEQPNKGSDIIKDEEGYEFCLADFS